MVILAILMAYHEASQIWADYSSNRAHESGVAMIAPFVSFLCDGSCPFYSAHFQG